MGPSSLPSYSVELEVYFPKTGGDFFLRETYSNSEITWCTWTNIINAMHLIIKISNLCLRYIHTAKLQIAIKDFEVLTGPNLIFCYPTRLT